MSNPNAISWFEIPVTNMDRAQSFYEKVIGKALRREQFPIGEKVYTLSVFAFSADGAKGCLMTGHDTLAPSTQGSLVYLDCVDSVDAALARALSMGAKLLKPKTALPPGMGFFAHIQDLDGNRVGVHAQT